MDFSKGVILADICRVKGGFTTDVDTGLVGTATCLGDSSLAGAMGF